MTIPGVGQLTALAFVAAIDDPSHHGLKRTSCSEPFCPLRELSKARSQSQLFAFDGLAAFAALERAGLTRSMAPFTSRGCGLWNIEPFVLSSFRIHKNADSFRKFRRDDLLLRRPVGLAEPARDESTITIIALWISHLWAASSAPPLFLALHMPCEAVRLVKCRQRRRSLDGLSGFSFDTLEHAVRNVRCRRGDWRYVIHDGRKIVWP
jgi:hypothetical protein